METKAITLVTLEREQREPNNKLQHTQPPQRKQLSPTKLEEEVPSCEAGYILFSTLANGSGLEPLSASQYFKNLKGLELEILMDPKNTTLPVDEKWPFLLRFPINCFGINLGLGSQSILWKILGSQGHIWFMQVPVLINVVIWSVATMALILIAITYTLKIIFYFEAVRREFSHPIRANFFFVPWIASMFLILGVPPLITTSLHPNIWMLLIAPVFALDIKVYGNWIVGGEQRLCKMANPCTHLSLLGNFVSALLLATVGYNELALFFWSVGFLHYLVLLVTLYQRLPSEIFLPRELHPVYFLFFALPSNACVSWAKVMGKFDLVAKLIYFFAIFMFFSMVARAKLFYGFRFNMAWWAYTLPLTILAIATVQYSHEVKHPIIKVFAALLTLISFTIVVSLGITTILHTFVWKSMFPNDMAIALQNGEVKPKKRIKELQEDVLPV